MGFEEVWAEEGGKYEEFNLDYANEAGNLRILNLFVDKLLEKTKDEWLALFENEPELGFDVLRTVEEEPEVMVLEWSPRILAGREAYE